MESLFFVLFFTVVVMVWMSEGSQAGMSVRQVCLQRVAMRREQMLVDVSWLARFSKPVTTLDSGPWSVYIRNDRRTDSGRIDHSST